MLEKINNPEDVSKLSVPELKTLAVDVRKYIIEVTAKNGGHVAPSLGATDIAIAILKLFDPLKDRIVWDVGHQSYAYKILTERKAKFKTLRQFGGISGFNNIFESKYDAFGVGHSSTSISASLGISVAKDLLNKKGFAVAIIGDGALTGGISFEALNHAGHLQKDMIVILNDNNMSISKNVGALQKYLAGILTSRPYNAIKNKIWNLLHQFPPRLKKKLIAVSQKMEENVINTFVPNIIFEDLDFKYVGPIDGHDMGNLVNILTKVKKNMTGPVLIHTVTQKGKGYEFAEDDASKFHGLGPYNIKTGKKVKSKATSYSQYFGSKLCKLAQKDKKIIAITAAMKDGTGLTKFADKYPNRFFDVGIAEQHAVTFAGGLAVQGMKPFVAIYSTFLQRALDQVIHDIALQKLPVVFGIDRAGLVGDDGATHHGAFDLSYLNFIPNMIVLAPSSAQELDKMMDYALEYKKGPVAIRYPRGKIHNADRNAVSIKTGKANIINKGKKIAFIGIGAAYNTALKVCEKIKTKSEIQPYLVDARFLKPIDKELLAEVGKKCDIIFTFEENSKIGGFGSSVQDYFSTAKHKIYKFGIKDEFITHGEVEKLKELTTLTVETIYPQIHDILEENEILS